MIPRLFLATALVLSISLATSHAQRSKKVIIKTEAPLRFNPPRFEVEPGTKLDVRLGNLDTTDQPHNIVFTYPGKREALVQAAMLLAEKGPEQEYVPQDESLVLAASSLITTGARGEVEFTVPDEPGVYPYVCTFPGHGLVMYGAMYVGVPMPEDAMKDPNVPKNALNQAEPITQRPYTQRIFMPDSGPASIAVALPGGTNFVWDAGVCSLRYVWTGDFIDPSRHFKGNGAALGKKLGDDAYWTGPGEAAFGDEAKFLGYVLNDEKIPTFRYRIAGKEIHETITEVEGGFVRTFESKFDGLEPAKDSLRGEGVGEFSINEDGETTLTATFIPTVSTAK